MRLPWRTFPDFLAEHLSGKVQKITVNAGFNCPNRSGQVGRGGCIYCNNASFSPATTASAEISAQIEAGKTFFARKYKDMRYLAYFQSYTPTNAPVEAIMSMLRQAAEAQDVAGVVVGTRPDCMPEALVEQLAALSARCFVMVELGAETSHDSTLEAINRCHTWRQTVDAVERTAAAGLPVGLHLINGLPGESEEMIMQTVDAVNSLPVDVVKFHQLQVVRGTELARRWMRGEVRIREYTPEDYLSLCEAILGRLRADIAIDRFVSQSPSEMLLYPRWGIKNYQFTEALARRLTLAVADASGGRRG